MALVHPIFSDFIYLSLLIFDSLIDFAFVPMLDIVLLELDWEVP